MTGIINKQTNLFSVQILKTENNFCSKIQQVTTTKVGFNSIGAAHLKSSLDYNGQDAETWIFVAEDARGQYQ